MIPQWTNFLTAQGAVIEDNNTRFNNNDAASVKKDQAFLVDLSCYGVIKVSGEDSLTFLHNQFTNDLKQLDDQHSQLSAYCSPKGRALTLFRIFKRGQDFYLSMPQELIEATLKRLRMFVLMSKVTLEDASEILVRIGYSSSSAEDRIEEICGCRLNEPDQLCHHDDLTFIRLPGQQARFEIYGPTDAMQTVWLKLAETAQPANIEAWKLVNIAAAIPTVYSQTVEAFVPQMINLQAINGLSFKKGCYPGQEIVARMQYLGKLKRRMYIASLNSSKLPQPGDSIISAANQQTVGTVVDAAPTDNDVQLLAVIEIAAAESGNLAFGSPDNALTLVPLPYELGA